jgi:hypothetical protein
VWKRHEKSQINGQKIMLRNLGICATYVVSSVVAFKSEKLSSFVREKRNTQIHSITKKKAAPTNLLKLSVFYAAACDSKKTIPTEGLNSCPTEDVTIGIEEKLKNFCTKEKIPHNFSLISTHQENERELTMLHF